MLFPHIEPFATEMVDVGDGHQVYVERVGNPKGVPVVFLHGGPGGGIDPAYRRYFDPKAWQVILFDQRGCGRSKPFASLESNTTWHLVADIERLRQRYGIERWWVFGGSWGSTLGLSYAQTHPDRCLGLLLRGIFMCRRHELLWFYQQGASRLFPEAWQKYLEPIPAAERSDLMAAYHRRLTSSDAAIRLEAAKAWSVWEASTSCLLPDPSKIAEASGDQFAEAFARIENHYFVHGAFFERDDQLLHNMPKIAHLPGFIVHGRYDVVCPVENAWELRQRWPGARLEIIPDSGHALAEKNTTKMMLSFLEGALRLSV